MTPSNLPRPGLLLGLLFLLSLALVPSAASPAAAGNNPCTGTVVVSGGGATPVLQCESVDCESACQVFQPTPPPGSAKVTSDCACGPEWTGQCCRMTLVSVDGGAPYPEPKGLCGLKGTCGFGRCGQLVDYEADTGASYHTAKCLPWA